MNMHNTELQRQAQHYAAVKTRIANAGASAAVAKAEDHYSEIIGGLRHVNKVLRQELDLMKQSLRYYEAENSRLRFEVEKWTGEPEGSVVGMKEIVEAVLQENYPSFTFKQIQSDDRRKAACEARNHCFYEVCVKRDDLTLAQKARFFKRDHSTYRRGIKLHAQKHGVPCPIPIGDGF